MKPTDQSRRQWLQRMLTLGGAGLGWQFLPAISGSGSFLPLPVGKASGSVPHRLLQIFLTGGWDSALATDPVIGPKVSSGAYQSIYNTLEISTVAGKSQLKVGPGLKPALAGFAAIPTAFVNGIFVEVTAHDLAVKYLFSGTLSLSRSREYPAFIARMGESSGGFPAHAILGSEMPLGNTKLTAPPIWANDSAMLANLFQGPYNQWIENGVIDRAHQLIDSINGSYHQALPSLAQASISSWQAANSAIVPLYQGNYREQFTLSDAVKNRYGVENGNLWQPPAMMASAFLMLKSGLTPYVTAAFGSYDTHTSHMANHLPELTSFAGQLNTLINDLNTTPDPADASLMLADTTTVMVVSEFVRTPKFNAGAGTDHWPACSCILMGKGVSDNTVIGATDTNAQAMGWNGSQGVAKTDQSVLLPDHLAATVVNHLGFAAVANEISEGRINGIFS